MLDELQLRVIVDGPTRVGHGQPFGFILSLEHTRQIGRESGGFGKYVQNAPPQRTPSHSAAAAGNHRDDLARNIHAALDGTFEVSAITFHDANVIAVDLPREGWQETPLAYCVARAKEAAVDRIPSIQLDMDFNDTSGQVVLPVRSQVQAIDAKEGNAGPRPCPGQCAGPGEHRAKVVAGGPVIMAKCPHRPPAKSETREPKQVFVNMLGRVGAVVARADLQKAPARPSCRSATSPRCERWQTTWETAWPPAWCFTGANKPLPSVPGSRRCHFRSCGKEAEPMPHDFGLDAKVLPMPLLRHIG